MVGVRSAFAGCQLRHRQTGSVLHQSPCRPGRLLLCHPWSTGPRHPGAETTCRTRNVDRRGLPHVCRHRQTTLARPAPMTIALELGASHVLQARSYAPIQPDRLIGIDRRPTEATILIADLEDPLPFKSDSTDGIFSAHTLEHLTWEGSRRLLLDSHRVLRPGGWFLCYVPDFSYLVSVYLAQGFPETFTGSWVETLVGQQRHPWDAHLSQWDKETLRRAFAETGFERYDVKTGRQVGEIAGTGWKPTNHPRL